MNMQPTNELRFVQKQVREFAGGDPGLGTDFYQARTKNVLQQKWTRQFDVGNLRTEYEWRDVPLEKEET